MSDHREIKSQHMNIITLGLRFRMISLIEAEAVLLTHFQEKLLKAGRFVAK